MKLEKPSLRPRIPGEDGIWVFIAGDMAIFSIFFVMLALCQSENPALFHASQKLLNQTFGLLNTMILLTSSWLVAQGMGAARRNQGGLARGCFWGALLCGLGFGVVKIFEYSEKIRAGLTPETNDFFMYYYVFTGIHFLHVVIGMVALTLMAGWSKAQTIDPIRIRNLESGASYWHLVDLLWIVLFALLYLRSTP